jgi:hypothetical protein
VAAAGHTWKGLGSSDVNRFAPGSASPGGLGEVGAGDSGSTLHARADAAAGLVPFRVLAWSSPQR